MRQGLAVYRVLNLSRALRGHVGGRARRIRAGCTGQQSTGDAASCESAAISGSARGRRSTRARSGTGFIDTERAAE